MIEANYPVYSMAEAAPNARAQFIRRTYVHLAGALLAFGLLETFLLRLDISRELSAKILSMPYGWLMVLGGLMVGSWMARGLASSGSRAVQYLGLAVYVVLQAVIFVPLMLMALAYAGPGLLVQAGIMTGLLFAGLTATVFITRKDFSFMGSILAVGGFVAIGLIVCAVMFGFSLGLWFSVAMIALAAGAILYDTSKVLHTYNEDQYVGASLELFASVALLLWYMIRLLMSLRD